MRNKKTIATITVIVGIIIVMCAAGGSDIGMFNIDQALLRVIIGFILIGGGKIYGVYVQKNL